MFQDEVPLSSMEPEAERRFLGIPLVVRLGWRRLRMGCMKSKVRTFSAPDRDIEMLAAIAAYHGFSRSAMIACLIRKEFWRIFPSGTEDIRPDSGARIVDDLPDAREER